MIEVKKLIIDILKPHQPNALEFASALAEKVEGIQISLTVSAVDEKTESVMVEIEGENINYRSLTERIKELGGSVHSIDKVQVVNTSNPE